MNTQGEIRVVKVFLCSPTDLTPERGRVHVVVAKLNREYEGLIHFQAVLWEERFYTADRSFQPQIPDALSCDIVVSMFWTRIGTELPADFPTMPNGKPYPSGSAYELLTALEASKDKGVPDVYVFRKTADAVLPMSDLERRRHAQTQLDALEAFWSEWFRAGEGQYKIAFQTFISADEFENRIEQLLRQWLDGRGLLGPRRTWPKEKGSPFPGLPPFEAEYAAVFFGRDRVIDEARRRLTDAAERHAPFLLIVGSSGAGKTSLVRAGLIPRLTASGIVPSIDVWRVARMRPSEGQAGAVASLVNALFAALPELVQGDLSDPALLGAHLRRGGEVAAQPVIHALARAADAERRRRSAAQPLHATLILLIDQLEELFALAVDEGERKAFSEAIRLLVADQVWCVATLRADLYEQLLGQPELAVLKDSGASLDLSPPGPAELAEIVRAPAAAAGLVFARDQQKGELDARLLADAKTADSLPLLQFTLRQLYERREEADGGARLTHDAYEALGGLEGAIGAEAERAVAPLPPESISTLPRLVRRLAEPAPNGKSLTLRDALRSEIATDPAEAAIADALLGARILTARKDATERPTLRLAHDAVLACWPRAAAAAQESRDFYRVRAEVEDALRRWQENGRPKDRLISAGVPLAEAERLVTDFATELPQELTRYVNLSLNRAQTRQRLLAAAAAFFLVLAVAATGAGMLARSAQKRANSTLEIARENESRALAALSVVATRDGYLADGLKLALAGWPRNQYDPRPRLGVALDSLALALSGSVPIAEHRHNDEVRGAILTQDERRILSWSNDGTVRLWDVASGRQIGPSMQHEQTVWGALLTRDETRIVSWSFDRTVRLWDMASGRQLGPSMQHDGRVYGALLMRDESRILSWSEDGTVRLWDVASGRQIGPSMRHDRWVLGALLTQDERRILSWSDDGTVRLWDVASGRQIGPTREHEHAVWGALLTRDERRILSWSFDRTVRLWDVASGRQIGPAMRHGNSVTGAVLTRDESRILSWSGDGTVRLWDAANGRQLGPAMRHDGSVKGAMLTRDQSRILSWSEDGTVRLWDVASGRQTGPVMRHDGSVEGAFLTRDESRILSWSTDKTVRLWDVASGRQLGSTMWHGNPVTGALLARDESRVLSWSSDKTVRLWDLANGRQIGPAMRHGAVVKGALLTRDESRILSWSEDETVRLWDLASGRQIGPAMRHAYTVAGALLTRDGSRILSWSADQTVRLWDVTSGRQIGSVMRHDGSVEGAFLTRDESRILSWSSDKTVRLWDVASGRQLGPSMQHDGRAYGALLTRDESRILSWSEDGTVRLWDVASGRQIGPSMRHDSSVEGAFLTRDESRILSWSFDRTVRLWDVASGRQIGPSMQHEQAVWGALLTRDESRILSWSGDGTVRLWDVASGRQLGPSMQHDGSVEGALLTRDESRILSWSEDETVRLWDVASGRQFGPSMRHDSKVYGALLTQDESRILSWSADKTMRFWDVTSGRQIGPAMQHESGVRGALLTRDESHILSWSEDETVRLWAVFWRGGNLLEIACNHSPPNHDLSAVSKRYGIKITDPICEPGEKIPAPDLSSTEQREP